LQQWLIAFIILINGLDPNERFAAEAAGAYVVIVRRTTMCSTTKAHKGRKEILR
jgi:hypothetical protein